MGGLSIMITSALDLKWFVTVSNSELSRISVAALVSFLRMEGDVGFRVLDVKSHPLLYSDFRFQFWQH